MSEFKQETDAMEAIYNEMTGSEKRIEMTLGKFSEDAQARITKAVHDRIRSDKNKPALGRKKEAAA